jgi:clathrin heavy chain
VSLDSDKALCVRVEGADGSKAVQIVSLATGQVTQRFPMGAESAILCPDGKSIAVRAGGALQIFNMELQKKTKSHKMPDADVPVYWCWASATTIGIVTASAVYHWVADGTDSAPAKVFDRAPTLAGTQIISYALAPDGAWMMLAGIKAGAVPGGPAEGCMQLYSAEKKVGQPLSAHAGCFATVRPPGRSDVAVVFAFVKYGGAQPELTIIEIGRSAAAAGAPFRPAPCPLPVPADAAADFPVSVVASKKHEVLYVTTKMGYAYVFDINSCSALARLRFSETPVFCTTAHEASGGVVAVAAKSGNVMLLTLNEGLLVNYVVNQLRKPELAMAIAGRLGLAGADELYVTQFNSQLAQGDIDGAIRTAASSPGGLLRTAQTIQRLQQVPPQEGQQPAVLRYFQLLMEPAGQRLNKVESIELSRPALGQGKVQLIERWLTEDKLTCSEALGDMVMAAGNPKLALSVYFRSGEAHDKVMQALLQAGEFAKIVPYALKFGVSTNFVFILAQLAQANPKAAEDFAKQLVREPQALGRPPLLEIPDIVQVFMGTQKLQECTAFLLDVLSEDKAEQGFLQTKVLELNLLGGAPQVAHAILGSNMFHHFDKAKIGALCERAQLYQRALELYSEIKDIKRVLAQSQQLDPAFLVAFFANHSADHVLECLAEMLKNPANEALVVKVATQYSEQLTPEELIKLFETAKMGTGLYYYLGAIVNASENKTVHYKYIVAAANLKQFKEVERVCRDSTVYEPAAVRDFLLDAKLADPRPLIYVCDRFGFVDELTSYLWNNKLAKFIEVYVQKVAPAKTPQVVGKLLDLDADEETIRALLDSVRLLCPVDPLVEEVERRNRLRLLQPWLEARLRDGATDQGTHNALGKIYVTLNKDPQAWLKSNLYYDSKVVGKFCEKLDPYLAYLAYRRANGACDAELIEVTNRNGLFKDQARYLVERQDLPLWERVLRDDNPHRRELIDQVTSTALPETKNPDEVSTTVKAFMAAKLPNELIGLLEKLVLGGGEFATNRNLQNLLILTAIKCARDPGAPEGRAMEYISRLDGFDGKEIAKVRRCRVAALPAAPTGAPVCALAASCGPATARRLFAFAQSPAPLSPFTRPPPCPPSPTDCAPRGVQHV